MRDRVASNSAFDLGLLCLRVVEAVPSLLFARDLFCSRRSRFGDPVSRN